MKTLAFERWDEPTPEMRDEAMSGVDLLRMWQDDRCAICGARGRLVVDHDHDIGLVRGLLCSGCNTTEGMSFRPIFVRYREHHPAMTLNIRETYVSIFGPAAPRQRATMDEMREAMDKMSELLAPPETPPMTAD